ncbi:MAG: hypothetical protein ACM3UR_12355 [Bacteroidota bacterium]|jgi:transcriptional regulator with XRE-family HTH domain|nr:hypothetical protein [Ruminiclostridium sp.]
MRAKDWFLNELDEVKNDVEFQTYDANLRFVEELIKISQKENIEHLNKFLSEKLNCSAAYISKILKGNPNLTIKKMVELGLAFNHKIEIRLVPVESSTSPATQAVEKNSADNKSSVKDMSVQLPKEKRIKKNPIKRASKRRTSNV